MGSTGANRLRNVASALLSAWFSGHGMGNLGLPLAQLVHSALGLAVAVRKWRMRALFALLIGSGLANPALYSRFRQVGRGVAALRRMLAAVRSRCSPDPLPFGNFCSGAADQGGHVLDKARQGRPKLAGQFVARPRLVKAPAALMEVLCATIWPSTVLSMSCAVMVSARPADKF
mgnify:CR=1 FL=1